MCCELTETVQGGAAGHLDHSLFIGREVELCTQVSLRVIVVPFVGLGRRMLFNLRSMDLLLHRHLEFLKIHIMQRAMNITAAMTIATEVY